MALEGLFLMAGSWEGDPTAAPEHPRVLGALPDAAGYPGHRAPLVGRLPSLRSILIFGVHRPAPSRHAAQGQPADIRLHIGYLPSYLRSERQRHS